jgi:hypothetical protein
MTDSREVTIKPQDVEFLHALPDRLDAMTDRLDLISDKTLDHDKLFDKISIIADAGQSDTDKLFDALAKAQAELTDPEQTGEAEVRMKSGGKYGYKYATLSGVLSTVRPVLSKHGLSLMQLPTRPQGDRGEILGLTTILGHKSGQSIENYFEMVVPDPSPQGVGSAMTYMRRYVAMSILAIAGAQDDDAEKAQPAAKLITAAQADKIFETADELFGDDAEAMLERMCKKIHMVEEVRLIPADEFDVAIKRMENQAKKRGTKAPEEVEGKSEKPAKPAKPSA